jgi:hypothetical protein
MSANPAIIYDGDFTVATACGPKQIEYPFEGDTESMVISQEFMQLQASFKRLPLDTRQSARLDAFLVNEDGFQNLGGGVMKWTRTYATIPQSRRENETFAYTLPGITSEGLAERKIISSAAAAGVNLRLTTSAAHGFLTGNDVIITYQVCDPKVLSFRWLRQVAKEVLDVTAVDKFDVAMIYDIVPWSLYIWDAAIANVFGRASFSMVVPSWLQYDYFLPGVSAGIASENDIPIYEPIRIIDSLGSVTDTYGPSTSPSTTEYRLMVKAGRMIVAEASSIKRWRGNIHERATRYIKAV